MLRRSATWSAASAATAASAAFGDSRSSVITSLNVRRDFDLRALRLDSTGASLAYSRSSLVSPCTDEVSREPTYRWVAGWPLALDSSLVAQPTRYRPLPSDVRVHLAARVNRRVMATNYRAVDRYQSMEQQP